MDKLKINYFGEFVKELQVFWHSCFFPKLDNLTSLGVARVFA
jgi:hypothetical protein